MNNLFLGEKKKQTALKAEEEKKLKMQPQSQELPKSEQTEIKEKSSQLPIIMSDIQIKPQVQEEPPKEIKKDNPPDLDKKKEEPIAGKPKTFVLIKEKKPSPLNSPKKILNNTLIIKEKEEKDNNDPTFQIKPHLLKLQEPTEIKSISKKSEQEIETPQGKANKKNVKIENSEDSETDILVKTKFIEIFI